MRRAEAIVGPLPQWPLRVEVLDLHSASGPGEAASLGECVTDTVCYRPPDFVSLSDG
jgi:hypothetical protein